MTDQVTAGAVDAGVAGQQTSLDQVLAAVAALAGSVQTAVSQLAEHVQSLTDNLTKIVETQTKRGTVDDDVHSEVIESGVGDPNDRAERMRNSRDRNDFYRDALQAYTLGFMRRWDAREADRYSAGSPVPPGAKAS